MTRILIAGRVLVLALFAVAAVLAVVALAGCSSGGAAGTTITSRDPTVQQIAAANGLTRVRDCGGGAFVQSSGIGWKNGVKYGVDTFSSTQARDSWLQLSKGFGGFPSTYQQGDTWVLYRAEDQSPGC